MAVNRKCPRCGGTYVQLSNERSKHGCLWTILLGWIYIIWVFCKWMLGLMILMCWDWWTAIIDAIRGKGHIWQCNKLFSGVKRVYYCHSCGYNFKA